MNRYYTVLVAIAFAFVSCTTQTSTENTTETLQTNEVVGVKEYPQGFAAYKGINIAHFLSQVYGWSPRQTFFTEADVKRIKSFGFDHIRLPIDEDQLWTEDGVAIDSVFKYMTNTIDWCIANDLCILVDLHILRSHHFNAKNGEGAMTLWIDTVAQNTFINLWDDIQERISHYPTNKVAYELLNEPAAPEADQWNSLIARAIEHIRKEEPNRILFVGANNWQTISNLPYLKVPESDTNIVISFHTYDPMLVTHYKASWTKFKDYTGPVQYPGLSANPKDIWSQLDSTDPSVKTEISGINKVYNSQVYDSMVSIAVKRAAELNLSAYCGEFGCLNNVDSLTRLTYYRDFLGALNKYNIGKAAWDYKGAFNIVGWDTEKMENTDFVDQAVIDILTQ